MELYAYIDESQRNHLTELMIRKLGIQLQEYSITTVLFEKGYYQKEFEEKWNAFRAKYNVNAKKAMHFVDYKMLCSGEPDKVKAVDPEVRKEFIDDKGNVRIIKLKNFFCDLKDILEQAKFKIIHNDTYWNKDRYLISASNKTALSMKERDTKVQFKKEVAYIGGAMLKKPAYIAMKKNMDMLVSKALMTHTSELKELPSDIEPGEYYNEKMPDLINIKLRFDADGKNFQARTDLKKAYGHMLTVGTDTVNQDVVAEVLDEIRFIRKEEVGHGHSPNHCGLEVVDFLCSMISCETRLKHYKDIGLIPTDDRDIEFQEGYFGNIRVEDQYFVDFWEIMKDKIEISHTERIYYQNK